MVPQRLSGRRVPPLLLEPVQNEILMGPERVLEPE
jgi:hypothetical protein